MARFHPLATPTGATKMSPETAEKLAGSIKLYIGGEEYGIATAASYMLALYQDNEGEYHLTEIGAWLTRVWLEVERKIVLEHDDEGWSVVDSKSLIPIAEGLFDIPDPITAVELAAAEVLNGES